MNREEKQKNPNTKYFSVNMEAPTKVHKKKED